MVESGDCVNRLAGLEARSPLFTELPRRVLLGKLYAAGRALTSRWRELCRRLRRPLIARRWHVLTWPRRPLPHVSCPWWGLGRGPPPHVAWRRRRFRPRRTLGRDRCLDFGATRRANAADAQLRSCLLGHMSVCRLNIAEEASKFVVACPVGIQCVHLAGLGPVQGMVEHAHQVVFLVGRSSSSLSRVHRVFSFALSYRSSLGNCGKRPVDVITTPNRRSSLAFLLMLYERYPRP